MKLNIKSSYTIDKKELISLSKSKEPYDNNWIGQITPFKDSILIELDFYDTGKHLIEFKNNNLHYIDLTPYHNKNLFNPQKTNVNNYPNGLVDYSILNYISFIHQDYFGIVNLFNLYLWTDLNSVPVKYSIKKQIPTIQGESQNGVWSSDINMIKVGHSTIENQIPVVFQNYYGTNGTNDPKCFSVLEFDKNAGTAEWILLEKSIPIFLDRNDFPHMQAHKNFNWTPPIETVSWNGKTITAYTDFDLDSYPKFGNNIDKVREYGNNYNFSALVENQHNGKLNEIIYQPEKIVGAKFTSNSDYLIFLPKFKKGGRPYIYNIEEREVIIPRLPRGYAKFETFEITSESIWLKFSDNKGLKIIECEI